MIIRPVQLSDAPAWERLRLDLWPEATETHAAEISQFFNGTLDEPQAVLVALEESAIIAFAELSIRYDIRGLPGKKVGYVEGLYVTPPYRARGIARQLLKASRIWAKENGCAAFASDRAERIIIDPSFQPEHC